MNKTIKQIKNLKFNEKDGPNCSKIGVLNMKICFKSLGEKMLNLPNINTNNHS